MELGDNKKESQHIIDLLGQARRALEKEDALLLKQLSDQTIHSASITQHTDFITIAVVLYSLNKIVERKAKMRIKRWDSFVRKFSDELTKSIASLKEQDMQEFSRHLDHAQELMVSMSSDLRTAVEDVIKKAQLNKAGKMYEHGISLQQTARIINVSPWELVSYVGQGNTLENPLMKTIDVKKRVKMLMDFIA